jgi:molybdate transport system substrate-binding protein
MRAALEVLCAGAVKSAIAELVRDFECETGHALTFTYGPVGSLRARIAAGEPADVAILTRPALEEMQRQGRVLAGTIADLGRVGVAIAVREGAAAPDVSTPEALRDALLGAASIAYGDPAKGDSSGIHFAHVLDRLGIAAAVREKTAFAPLGLAVAERVASGEAQLGATQASVILACKGVQLAGMLPARLQHITTYSAAVVAQAESVDAAKRFVSFLTSPAARSRLAISGFDQGE